MRLDVTISPLQRLDCGSFRREIIIAIAGRGCRRTAKKFTLGNFFLGGQDGMHCSGVSDSWVEQVRVSKQEDPFSRVGGKLLKLGREAP